MELDEIYKPIRILKINVYIIKENLEKKYNKISVSQIKKLETGELKMLSNLLIEKQVII